MTSIREIVPGVVYIADQYPEDAALQSGAYVTAVEFATAAIAAGKTENYGTGTMRDIAKRAVLSNAPTYPDFRDIYWDEEDRQVHYRDPHAEAFDQIGRLMNASNTLVSSYDSRHRVLLGMGFLFDTWRAHHKIDVPSPYTPRLAKLELRIVGLIFAEEYAEV